MDEQRENSLIDETVQAQTPADNDAAARGANDADGIGAGKKTGVYGCAFLILAVVIVFIVLVLTGIYNPFQGTEGVGP